MDARLAVGDDPRRSLFGNFRAERLPPSTAYDREAA
jgi:hypothetical protein